MNPNDSKKLEALISQAVKDLPSRPAPRSLESRVLAEIQRRAALPWYQQSFARWPVAMRGAFLLASASAAAVVTVMVIPYLSGTAPAVLQPYTSNAQGWYDSLLNAVQVLTQLGSNAFSRIPTLWLYAGLAAVASSYAALVGIGTAAYRAVRTQTSS